MAKLELMDPIFYSTVKEINLNLPHQFGEYIYKFVYPTHKFSVHSMKAEQVFQTSCVFENKVANSTFPCRNWGLIRKPASFMTSICDERGQELIYAGMPITDIFKEEIGIGGVLSLLWFQRRWVISKYGLVVGNIMKG